MVTPHHLAYFITPHGFGHAARAAAIMVALQERDPTLHFHIFTQVPQWFFQASLVRNIHYYDVCTDIGLIQTTALSEDLPATVRRLATLLPYNRALIASLATILRGMRCAMVLCDIAPMGIVAARAAGIPSVLIENFTWDWIYRGYLEEEPRLAGPLAYLQETNALADYRVQLEPVCAPCPAALTVPPVSRCPQHTPQETRAALHLPADANVVLMTMGGIPEPLQDMTRLHSHPETLFVVLGGARTMVRQANVLLLPHRPAVLPLDLVYACDAVVSKAGYSILAETYHAGVPFGYVIRSRFREAPVLARYIAAHMPGLALTETALHQSTWLASLPDLLALPRQPVRVERGAAQVAHFIAARLAEGAC